MSGLISKINQGRFDRENLLLNLRNNALRTGNRNVLDSVNQRLKKAHPKIFQRLVGPLWERARDPDFECYCNHPKPLYDICDDIISGRVPHDALTCDECWREDISKTWGYYGYTSSRISREGTAKLSSRIC
jgi:hypothetical protein